MCFAYDEEVSATKSNLPSRHTATLSLRSRTPSHALPFPDQVRTSGVECILVGGSAVDGPGDSGSGSGSGDFGGNSSEDFELGSLASNTTLAEDGKSGTVCKILGAGYAWCDFLRYAVQFCNCFAIMAGVAGDVLSDKVHATQVSPAGVQYSSHSIRLHDPTHSHTHTLITTHAPRVLPRAHLPPAVPA